ncbi:hypothetical protein, partial [Bacillus sonorensis]|uniref:hypothetical protein n=1 Tax=Bacillus sonorensis TaxID=119858 RepID=UPI002DBD1964
LRDFLIFLQNEYAGQIKRECLIRHSQLVEKTTFFLQAFLFYTVSLDIHQVSDAEKALPHA